MKVYRYEKDMSGKNGNSFSDVSQENFRYFAATFEGALMWGFLYNTLHPESEIYDGYIVEYEIEGEYMERYINSLKEIWDREIKISHNNCQLIKRTYVVIGRDISIDENGREYNTPPFIEEYEAPEREWIKKWNYWYIYIGTRYENVPKVTGANL